MVESITHTCSWICICIRVCTKYMYDPHTRACQPGSRPRRVAHIGKRPFQTVTTAQGSERMCATGATGPSSRDCAARPMNTALSVFPPFPERPARALLEEWALLHSLAKEAIYWVDCHRSALPEPAGTVVSKVQPPAGSLRGWTFWTLWRTPGHPLPHSTAHKEPLDAQLPAPPPPVFSECRVPGVPVVECGMLCLGYGCVSKWCLSTQKPRGLLRNRVLVPPNPNDQALPEQGPRPPTTHPCFVGTSSNPG